MRKIFARTIMMMLALSVFTACGGGNEAPVDLGTNQPAQNVPAQAPTGGASIFDWEDYNVLAQSGEVTIRKYHGTATDLIIPAEINGMPVTAIGLSAFSAGRGDTLVSVVIPDSVRRIESHAFAAVPLKSLTLGNSVEYIGNWAFARAEVSVLVIPDSVVHIGEGAFAGASENTARMGVFSIGSGVIYIGESAFIRRGLTALDIPDNVEYIGPRAFAFNPDLTIVRIGSGVRHIEEGAFIQTTARIELASNVANLDANAFDRRSTVVIAGQEIATPQPGVTAPPQATPPEAPSPQATPPAAGVDVVSSSITIALPRVPGLTMTFNNAYDEFLTTYMPGGGVSYNFYLRENSTVSFNRAVRLMDREGGEFDLAAGQLAQGRTLDETWHFIALEDYAITIGFQTFPLYLYYLNPNTLLETMDTDVMLRFFTDMAEQHGGYIPYFSPMTGYAVG